MRYSRWDIVLVALSVIHAAVLFAAPSVPVIAIGLWWNSNTISHNFIHLPFFRSGLLNRVYSMYLSLLLGIPQTLWRQRHMAHHAGERGLKEGDRAVITVGCALPRLRFADRPYSLGPATVGALYERPRCIETFLVLAFWSVLFALDSGFFLTVYLPGYLTGLGLCYIHGHFEHVRGVISHYGVIYNLSFFNDGYHVEHHLRPGEHWTHLPAHSRPAGATSSRWPAVLRWLEVINLEFLERVALRSRLLQNFLLKTHERAFRALLQKIGEPHSVTIVGGGLFPRTALIVEKLLPDSEITIVDASAENIRVAKGFLNGRVRYVHAVYEPSNREGDDLVIIPLAFIGDRRAAYAGRRSGATVIHDWIWSRRAEGVRVSLFLLKRLNLVKP